MKPIQLPIQVEVFIFHKGKDKKEYRFLLVRRLDREGGFWQLPVGSLRDGEQLGGLASTVCREVAGITNIKRLLNLRHFFQYKANHQVISDFLFAVETVTDRIVIDPNNFADYKWFSAEDMRDHLKFKALMNGFNKLQTWLE